MAENKGDRKAADSNLEALCTELSTGISKIEERLNSQEETYKALREELGKTGEVDAERKAKIEELATSYAAQTKELQDVRTTVDYVKAEMDSPLLRNSGRDLEDNDRAAAVELQKRAFLHKGGTEEEFVPDMENLVSGSAYRSAVRKLMKVGVENRQKIIRGFSEEETRAFEAASLDSGFFSPELLGLEVDCDPECAYITDLYDSISVNRSTFQYLKIDDYGALGEYGCDATCDGPLGPEGNIRPLLGQTEEFRGVFCLQRKTVAEANYDLLGFMFRAIQRSHRIQRNERLITGPDGWLSGDGLPVRTAAGGVLTAQEFRLFLASTPVDFGAITAVMHQNMFAYLVSMQKSDGGFVYMDGDMCVSPDNAPDCIRISNCLPDATEDLTKGSTDNPFDAGAFIMAAAAWDSAYAEVTQRPLWIEQYEGGSNAWCVMYQFGSSDGGFLKCGNAGRILQAGAAATPPAPGG